MKSCTLILVALAICTTAVRAEEPKLEETTPGELRPGWKEDDLKAFTEACADAIVKPAIQSYQEMVTASGRTDAKPFPEKELRDSVSPMCACISRRLAEKWTMKELTNAALERAKPFVEEALGGGQCKPEGLLADMLEQAREKKPD